MRSSVFALLFSGAISAWGGTYYVDYANGSNTSTGKTAASAWQNCPGDSSATSIAASTQIKAGDTVIFKGGVVYHGTIGIKASGAAGSEIIYDGNSAGTFGSGNAIIDGDNLRFYGLVSKVSNPAYIRIRNFEVRNIKYNAGAPSASSGIRLDDATHCIVAACYVHDIGYWNNDGSIWPAGSGINLIMPVNCLVTGCNITKTGNAGIALDGAQNCVVSHNNIHDYITWGVDLAGDYQLCTGNVICDNAIHDLYYYDLGFYGAAGDPPHTDFVFIRMGGGQHPLKNVVERNLFYNNYSFVDFGGTSMTFLSYADSTIIRNNVYINPHNYYAAYFGWTSAGTKFYNNTIYSPRSSGCRFETHGFNDIRNNIIIVSSEGLSLLSDTDRTSLTSDYNLFYCVNSARAVVRVNPSASWSIASWQALGYDAHSRSLAGITDLKFNSTSGFPTACQTMDLHLSPGSLAIGAATRIAGFSTDKDSASRPATTAWDVGAYEHKTTAVMPTPQETAHAAQLDHVASVLSIDRLRSLLGAGEYTVLDLQGRTRQLGSVERNMVYLLRNAKLGTVSRVLVTR